MCLNTFKEFMTNTFDYLDNNPGSQLVEIIGSGFTASTAQYCCPNCDVYMVGDVDIFLKFIEAKGNNIQCCLNINSSIEEYIVLAESIGITSSGPGNVPILFENKKLICCDQFQTCVDSFKETLGIINFFDLKNAGIVEYSKLPPDDDNLCFLSNLLLSRYDKNTSLNYMQTILQKGIVIFCSPPTVFGTTSETYLKYAEAVGLTQSVNVP